MCRTTTNRYILALWTVSLVLTGSPANAGRKKSQECAALPEGQPQVYTYEVVGEFEHDPTAFTQGLLFGTRCYPDSPDCADVLYESTGMYGKSDVRITRLDTGAVEARAAMDAKWFGEGLARRGDLLYQVTWQGPQGFVYSAADLKLVGEFKTPLKDGWGIALDDTGNAYSDSTGKGGGGGKSGSGGGGGGGGLLVVSDGSDTLTWIDPDDGYRRVRSVKVQSNDRPIVWLNELEFVQGELWANVWQTDCIARICPATGNVTGWLLLHGVRDALLARNLPQRGAAMDVLNGIAWDADRRRLFVTGKHWPRVFEVVPVPANPHAKDNKRRVASCFVN